MTQHPKKKLCWNCEGSVALNVEACPYCGVSVVPASLDSGNAGFNPPYKFVSNQEATIPASPYKGLEEHTEEPSESIGDKEEEDNEASFTEFKRMLVATVLLLSGSVFFLFGLALALFSRNGIFTLQWNGSFWFVYSGISFPLLLVGWRTLLKLDQ